MRNKVTNEQKEEYSKILYLKLSESIKEFNNNSKFESRTNIPFFDINFKEVLSLIIGDQQDVEEINKKKEIQILNQNIDIFEQLFGFSFENNRFINLINNQSLFTNEQIFPSLYDKNELNDNDIFKFDNLTELKNNNNIVSSIAKGLVLNESSLILNSDDFLSVF